MIRVLCITVEVDCRAAVDLATLCSRVVNVDTSRSNFAMLRNHRQRCTTSSRPEGANLGDEDDGECKASRASHYRNPAQGGRRRLPSARAEDVQCQRDGGSALASILMDSRKRRRVLEDRRSTGTHRPCHKSAINASTTLLP